MEELVNPGAGTADAGLQDSGGQEYEGQVDGNDLVNPPPAKVAPQAVPPTAEPATAKPETSAEQQVEYIYQGKKFQIPLSKAILKLQQAHVLDERFKETNAEKAEIAKLRAELDPLLKNYQEIDTWAKGNPALFDEVVTAINQKRQLQGLPPELNPDDPMVKANMLLMNRLNSIEETIKQREEREKFERQEAENQRAEAQLNEQLGKIKELYPWKNLDATDEAGTKLETAVIKYGLENNLPPLEAFRALFYDEIIHRAREEGEKAALESIKRKHELGVVSSGGANRPAAPKRSDFKSVSWDQLVQEAKQEYLR